MFVSYDRRLMLENAVQTPELRHILTQAYANEASDRRVMGGLEPSLPYLRKLIQLQPDDGWHWYLCALTELNVHGDNTYREICSAMMSHFQEHAVAGDDFLVPWACSLRPTR